MSDNEPMSPPMAEHRDHVVVFGKVDGQDRGAAPMDPPRVRHDPLFWLRDDARSNPDVLAHLQREKAYFDARTRDLRELTEQIYREHLSHIQETDVSPTYVHGPYVYYTREIEGKSYKIHCRRPRHRSGKANDDNNNDNNVDVNKVNDDEEEEVLMDINAFAQGKAFCDVHDIRPAPPSHGRVAYSVDWSGNEVYAIALREMPRKDGSEHKDGNAAGNGDGATATTTTAASAPQQHPHDRDHGASDEVVVTGTNGDIVWDHDGSSFFYVTKDAALRDDKVWRHVLGQPQSSDVCVYADDDPLFSVYVDKSGDGLTCLIGSVSSETSEVHLLDLRRGCAHTSLELVRRRERGVRYSVEMHGTDTLVILTNADGAVNNKLVCARRAEPAAWHTVLLPHRDDTLIEECVVRQSFAVLAGRRDGLTRVWTMLARTSSDNDSNNNNDNNNNNNNNSSSDSDNSTLDATTLREVAMDEPIFTVRVVASQMCEYAATTFRLAYSSLATPDTWLDVDPRDHASRRVVKRRKVGGGFCASDYVVERRYAVAPDRTRVPLSLVYHKDLDVRQPQPCLLYGYGSYGLSMDPAFAIKYLPYVERGMIYAIAHIRGGAEMGRAWYEVGAKYLTKRNTFADFIAAAEHLIDSGLTRPSLLACEGRSAGGLLIGAVLNMRPDLFRAAIAGVPFVDVMTTMSDPTIPLTTGEWEEWGNPNEYRYFDYMLSYSPVDNVRAQAYPALMVQAGLHDPRVAYWEPAKWVCKLRECKTDDHDVLLNMDLESGHFSAKDRYKYWRESAIQQAFVCKHLRAMARRFVAK